MEFFECNMQSNQLDTSFEVLGVVICKVQNLMVDLTIGIEFKRCSRFYRYPRLFDYNPNILTHAATLKELQTPNPKPQTPNPKFVLISQSSL